jgi:hypothetical protein
VLQRPFIPAKRVRAFSSGSTYLAPFSTGDKS